MIEDELSKVYNRLTEELDIHRVPSLAKEKEQFSWFMNYKQCTERQEKQVNFITGSSSW